jgi:hypothetical protein
VDEKGSVTSSAVASGVRTLLDFPESRRRQFPGPADRLSSGRQVGRRLTRGAVESATEVMQ